ncbi:uncharacterized protein PHALS_02025 [Plasmopara halstedii]|uniref:Cilia- and flagella-associated protein 45 n=1 Tax=Plasmopara halstedii TaxID=4781 RepID=A0A0P1ATQ6_PLAHL|nr:uncharacterized protein PHALS_02025 [Plasmopara halstedii]CEG45749.1 hypothetical protein PHALS_02025 [Plasmopara halstedii]|eukprot:XP_024582118.1 hypothetical protein PHALS_02025 [Plasmopara halstedii]
MPLKTPHTQHSSSATRQAGKDIAGVLHILSKTDLARIKERSMILTETAIEHIKLERETQQAVARHESMERKRRMMEKEAEVRARREQSAMEMELDAERQALLSGNEMVNNQHLESLRKINSLSVAAIGYQLCDSLKEHQRERKIVETRYDNVHDSIMERDRRCNNQKRKDDESIAFAKRMEARQMLEVQIAERQRQLIRDEEAKDIESRKILDLYKQYEVEERKKTEQHREKQMEMMRQVTETNERIKDMKEQMLIRDKKEEIAAAAYLRNKVLEEEAKLNENARIRKLKELRIAKLRAQQEKAQDKEALQDEIRSKKSYEETEKKARLKKEQDKEKKQMLLQSIMQDRKKQEIFHIEQSKRMRALDANTDLIGQQQAESEYQRLKAAEIAINARNVMHNTLLLQQIEANNQRRIKDRLFEQNDAKLIEKKAMKDSILAEKVRIDTLQKLKTGGVSEKYLRNLRRMEINETNA